MVLSLSFIEGIVIKFFKEMHPPFPDVLLITMLLIVFLKKSQVVPLVSVVDTLFSENLRRINYRFKSFLVPMDEISLICRMLNSNWLEQINKLVQFITATVKIFSSI